MKLFEVEIDGHRTAGSYNILARDEEEARKKGRILYGDHDLIYHVFATLKDENPKIEEDDFMKFFKEMGVSKEEFAILLGTRE